jgi:hypothetical protein
MERKKKREREINPAAAVCTYAGQVTAPYSHFTSLHTLPNHTSLFCHKRQIINILVFVATTQLCHCSGKAVIENTQKIECDYIPIKT